MPNYQRGKREGEIRKDKNARQTRLESFMGGGGCSFFFHANLLACSGQDLGKDKGSWNLQSQVKMDVVEVPPH